MQINRKFALWSVSIKINGRQSGWKFMFGNKGDKTVLEAIKHFHPLGD